MSNGGKGTAEPVDWSMTMAASWSTTCGSRIRDRNGGSSIADSVSCWLVMTKMADPLSCWHLMAVVVDRDRGGSS